MVKMRISGIIVNRVVKYVRGKGCVIMNNTIVREIMVGEKVIKIKFDW